MPWGLSSVVLVVTLCVSVATATDVVYPEPLGKIAFGSCHKPDKNQSIWNAVAREKADVFLWTGDVVYADTQFLPLMWGESPVEVMEERYRSARRGREYAAAVANSTVVGVWDDHDFGKNNGGAEWPHKETVKRMFLEFIGEPRDSPRRRRQGMYGSYMWGPPGRRVKAILLDVRYFLDPGAKSHQMLGKEQWRWLEAELRDTEGVQFTLIVSGVQVVPLGNPFAEHWGLFPSERERLFDLIERTRAPGVVFVTGDVHYAVISVAKCTTQLNPHRVSDGAGYPLYEICSSGLTHAWEEDLSFLGTALFRWAFGNVVPPFQRVTPGSIYARRNYGTLAFDWDSPRGPSLEASIHAVDGAVVMKRVITAAELTASAAHGANYAACEDVSRGLVTHAWTTFRLFASVALAALAAFVAAFVAARRACAFCMRILMGARGAGAATAGNNKVKSD